MERDPLDLLLGGPYEQVTPRAEFADALLGRLLIALTEESESPTNESGIRRPTRPIETLAARVPPEQGLTRRHWPSAQFVAFVVVVLLLLSGTWILFGPSHQSAPKSIPAAFSPLATPKPVAAGNESLLRFTLPAGVLPKMTSGGSTLFQFTVPEGALWDWAAKTEDQCCHGLVLDYVISGTYSIRFTDEPVQVVRRGGSPETVAAGTEIMLGSGDALISRLEFAHNGANGGTTPAQLLRWDFVGTASSALLTPPHWMVNADDSHFFLTDVGDGPMTITIRSVDLQHDEEFQAPAEVRDDLVFAVPMNVDVNGVSVTSHVTNVGEGRVLNFGNKPVQIYVLTVESRDPLPGEATADSSPSD